MKEALGTACFITLYDQGNEKIYNDIFSRIHEIENLMSVNIPSSDVSRINAAAGIEAVHVHKDVFYVIENAKYFAQLSDGAFDPTVGPLVSLWGFDSVSTYVPSGEEIEKALPLVNWRNIELDKTLNTVYLNQKGMALDLGAIAKGYAADEVVKIAKQAGIKRALIDLGGNIFVIGEKIDKTQWNVGIQNPYTNRGDAVGFIQTKERTIVTSGIYERYFEEDGKTFHHIFDPKLGFPVQNGLVSVTIITDNSMTADALSTAVFVLGYDKGLSLIETLPDTDAVFVFNDNSIRTTAGVKLKLLNTSFYIPQ